VFLGAAAVAWGAPAVVDGHYASAREQWLSEQGPMPEVDPGSAQGVATGLIWDNGGANSVDGLASERNTAISGTGGPESDHASTVADDFLINSFTTLGEIRVCLYHNGPSAEMYIYRDDGGSPALPVTAPLWGAPTTADIVSSTFQDNTARCPNAFGLIGRQYVFSQATTGVAISLAAGHYWLAVVGEGGSRSFWAQSSPSIPLNTGRWGSTFFTIPYWTDTNTAPAMFQPSFAFEITATSGLAAPTLSIVGLFAAVLGLLAFGVLRVRRRA
jgi:hypothetical protein